MSSYYISESEKWKWSRSVVSDSLRPIRLLCPWDCPGNSTGVDCHFLLQWIFLTHGSNPGLPHCRQTLYRLSHQGSPIILVGNIKNRELCIVYVDYIFFLRRMIIDLNMVKWVILWNNSVAKELARLNKMHDCYICMDFFHCVIVGNCPHI